MHSLGVRIVRVCTVTDPCPFNCLAINAGVSTAQVYRSDWRWIGFKFQSEAANITTSKATQEQTPPPASCLPATRRHDSTVAGATISPTLRGSSHQLIHHGRLTFFPAPVANRR